MGFDLFILAILLITTIRGAAKGVAWQLAGIAALVLCFMFATPLSLTIAPMIKLEAPLNRWVAMLGIYIVFSFGTFAIARGFREALEKAKFVEFDRHLGALFGLLKGAIIALSITFFAVAMSKQARESILKTHTGYAAAHIMNALDPVMPKELHAILEPYIHQLDAVDPDLALQRERHHDRLHDQQDSDESIDQPGRGYRPTGRRADQTESEDERAEPRDPFQDEGSQYFPDETVAAPNRPRLNDPEVVPEAEDPSNSALNFDWLSNLPHLASKVAPAIQQQLHEAFENTAAEHRDEFIQTLKKTPPETAHHVARNWQKGRPQTELPPRSEDAPFDVPPPPRVIKRPKPLNDPAIPIESDPNLDTQSDPFESDSQAPVRIRKPDDVRSPPPPAPGRLVPPRPDQAQFNQAPPIANRQQLLLGIAKIFSSRQAEQAQKMTEIETLMLGLPDPVTDGTLDDWLADLRGSDPDPDPHTDLATSLNVRIARQVEANNVPHDQLSPEWQTKLERFFKN